MATAIIPIIPVVSTTGDITLLYKEEITWKTT
jgi:hypothetical protein